MVSGFPSWQGGRMMTPPFAHILRSSKDELTQSGLPEQLTDTTS